ncbi:MAG: SPOR domain-containing protein [Muribaculaceae bacterium]|nr:SPOR domain-containing protein [Muribaculaceae bacterium]MBR1474359.1 SPOR domain-containing protein [Muribaculaceae bacterium]
MKNYLTILLVAVVAVMTGCHSNEANYKAAYDKAMQKHQEGIGQEAFDKIQAEARKYTEVINGDSVRLLRMSANVTLDSASVAKRYNVIVAGFKQQFNAQTMRDRLRKEEGFPSYILFGGHDRKYYVVVKGFDEKDVAAAFIKGLDTHMKMRVLEPIPWILEKR